MTPSSGKGRDGRRLGQGAEVVGQTHQAQRVDERRICGEIPHARAGEGERLAHGAGDGQARTTFEQGQSGCRVSRRELLIRLVHDDDRPHVKSVLRGEVEGQTLEWRLKHLDGHFVHVETAIADMREDNDVQGIILTSRDVLAKVNK